MGFTAMLGASLIGGLVLAAIIKGIFNGITGDHSFEFSDLRDFFIMFLVCSVIVFVLIVIFGMDSCN